jgi:hypothetical protein
MKRRLLFALTTGLSLAIASLAVATPAGYEAMALRDRAAAEGRGIDQDANPAYHQGFLPLAAEDAEAGTIDRIAYDPFRLGWSGTRGVIAPVEIKNRYGAMLRGHLYRPALPWTDPVTGRRSSGPLPTVIALFDNPAYDGLYEQIAEAGYVVLSLSVQGQGTSDKDPSPKEEFCGPHADAWWRQPQEVGLVERGVCAGYDAPAGKDSPLAQAAHDALAPLSGTPVVDAAALPTELADLEIAARTGNMKPILDPVATAYDGFRTRYVFAGLDAAAWLASDLNPWRDLVDLQRLGLVGHSASSDGALVTGNGDPQHRFSAVVAWDDYGRPPAGMHPTIPTMIHQSEQEAYFGPWLPKPDPRVWDSYRTAASFRAAGVPSALLALRGSTHQEWTYLPYAANEPLTPLANSSSLGTQVSAYYTVAWLDRWLKGKGRSQGDAQVKDARRRLLARTFDGSTDASSIGQGTYDPVTQRNVPYHIAGLAVGDRLSGIFRSELDFDRVTCLDWEAGCPVGQALSR